MQIYMSSFGSLNSSSVWKISEPMLDFYFFKTP